MTDDEKTFLFVCLGVYVLARMQDPAEAAKNALEKGGAMLFDLSHGDAMHVRDLPRPDATNAARFKMLFGLATQVGFPDPTLAAAIAMAESRGNPAAMSVTSKERSVGLWQINMLAHKQYSEGWLKVPENNARAALLISKQGKDWRPWGAYTNGSYKKFVP